LTCISENEKNYPANETLPGAPAELNRRKGQLLLRQGHREAARSTGSTRAPQRRYEIAPGTEGIAFGSAGQLWAVSEAGSRHIYDHPFLGLFEPFFPLVFALDLSRLE
jgi:hypothetical protein